MNWVYYTWNNPRQNIKFASTKGQDQVSLVLAFQAGKSPVNSSCTVQMYIIYGFDFPSMFSNYRVKLL